MAHGAALARLAAGLALAALEMACALPASAASERAKGAAVQQPATSAAQPPQPQPAAAKPLAGIETLFVDPVRVLGDAQRCGLEPVALWTSAMYPVATSSRLRVGQGTSARMHVRITALHIANLDHCILHADMRVMSLQQVELAHSRSRVAAFVPLWEKGDIRLTGRELAARIAQERVRDLAEQFMVAWAAEN